MSKLIFSLLSQNYILLFAMMKYSGHSSGYLLKNILVVGASDQNSTAAFTGYMNMILLNLEPQAPVEMLSNAYRSPVEHSQVYEPNLFIAVIAKDINTPDYTNYFHDFSYTAIKHEASTTPDGIQLKDLPSDKVSVCQFYPVNVSSFS